MNGHIQTRKPTTAATTTTPSMSGFVAVHTGAGNYRDETVYKKISKKACLAAANVLRSGGTALDACEAAIVRLENCGHTNAGYGSNLTWDGNVECEACIMDGKTLQFGACTNLTNVCNPISLARAICERQSKLLQFGRIPPMVLSGDGASKYAKELNIPLVEPIALHSKKAIKCYRQNKSNIAEYETKYNLKLSALDTVGAVCVDGDGNCVAGCSSGGLILKLSGRVGQAATYGAGCWAQNTHTKCVATCTTGNGEYLMKTLLAKEIVDSLMTSECSIRSLNATFKEKFLGSPFLANLNEIFGGALSIVYDQNTHDGEILWSHTTQSLCLSYMSTSQRVPKFVFSSLPSYSKPGLSTVINGQHFKF